MAYEGFSSPTGIDWRGDYGLVKFGGGQRPLVQFYKRPILNPIKSQDQGSPVYDAKTFIKIQHPAETLQVIDREMKPQDRVDYPHEWRAFEENREQVPDGTPIYYLFPDHPDIAENLKSLGVHTIEQCAKLSAHAMDRIGMGAQDYVNAATQYLDAAKQGVTFHKMRSELAQRDNEISTLRKQLDMQRAQIDMLMQQMEGPGEYVRMPANMARAHGAPISSEPAAKKDHFALPANLKRARKPKDEEADAAA